MNLLLLLFIGYYTWTFVQLMIKMRKNKILPTTNEEIAAIRKYPRKVVDAPTFSKQKVGIIIYLILLVFVITMYLIGTFQVELDWSLFLLLFIPLINADNLLNLFAVAEDGLLIGNRFIDWKKLKSFRFVPIDFNHKYYGYEEEINKGYELIIKERLFSVSCIVTSEAMKEKLSKILCEHGVVNEEMNSQRSELK